MWMTLSKSFRAIAPGDHWRLALAGVLMLVSAILEGVGVALVLPFIRMVNDPGWITSQPTLAAIYRALGLGRSVDFIILCGIGFVLLLAFKNVVYLLMTAVQGRFGHQQAAAMAQRLLGMYLNMPYVNHLKRNSVSIITIVNQAVDQLYIAVLLAFTAGIAEVLAILAVLSVLLVAEPVVTSVVAAVLGGAMVGLFLLMHRYFEYFGRMNYQHYESRLKTLNHALHSIKEVKVLGRTAYFLDAYTQVRRANARLLWHNGVMVQVPRAAVETLVIGGIVGIIVVVLWQGRDASDITPAMALFAVSAFRIMPAVNRLLMAASSIRQGATSVERIHADLVEMAKIPPAPLQSAPALEFRHELILDGIRFTYPETAEPVLSGVSFTVSRGESVGLVGTSGAGKTTVIDLILGLLSPDAGRILVDGHDVAERLRSWQDLIGYVPQSIYLADDTIRGNVAFGVPPEQVDDAQVGRALVLAHMDKVVSGLPHGLDTLVGEHGVRLSGGQRQRLGLARALYHDPAVLIMDEATSALDGETERSVTDAIESLRGDKTMIIVAHRLSTVCHCDKIVLLSGGQVADAGPFATLAARNPDFSRMIQLASVTGQLDT